MVGSGLVLGLSPSMNSISSRLGVTNLKRNERRKSEPEVWLFWEPVGV